MCLVTVIVFFCKLRSKINKEERVKNTPCEDLFDDHKFTWMEDFQLFIDRQSTDVPSVLFLQVVFVVRVVSSD